MKGVVTDEVWARGVAVSSAAIANAVPVAEFIFAAAKIGRLVLERLRTLDVEVGLQVPFVDPAAAGLGATAMELDELCA